MAVSSDVDLWLRRFHPASASAPRLVCFPHAGGAASFYVPLSRALSPVAEVRSVQYPGRQDRRTERPETAIEPLADRIADVLRPLTDRPLAFFGHSMGSTVAFEVTRRLEAAGGPVPFVLFASGRRAPSASRAESVHLLDDEGFLREIRALGGTDPRILADPEILKLILPPTRADYRAIETYSAPSDAVIGTAITVLVGDSDAKATVAEAEQWRAHTTGAFTLKVFPGGHFYLSDQQAAVIDTVSAGLVPAATAGPSL
ncbi:MULTISPECIES: thioesterase II family protein [Frankia]|uniref:Thioesterase n=2 Tax=Frankia casuarinae (strain DSM 45818 / CECT 9043 / HFP020203 / CcI3) TaxID=106370 RepID=Q2JAB3_FRACC|nr:MULTISPECIES: alpha/beta fold hydrolase [unclassified Frankia]ABD11779.1 Thioesterase [Frankia casuarinae]OHV56237.1 oleoyl-ACP hydrolase [Frankia sp. CgIS1]ORT47960.1 thioesterase [Frankia sp. KB5]